MTGVVLLCEKIFEINSKEIKFKEKGNLIFIPNCQGNHLFPLFLFLVSGSAHKTVRG